MTFQTVAPLEHATLNATNRPATFFVDAVERGYLTLDAPYQRGAVWTVEQKMGLVRSWLTGVPIPAVILNDRTSLEWHKNYPDEDLGDGGSLYAVIDGKQRILAAIAWFTGELAIPASWVPADNIETSEDTDDGPYVRYTGLTVPHQRRLGHRCVLPCAEGRLPSIEDEAQVYLLVNGAGTPQTAADMLNAAQVAGGITHR